jgi:hypothetical protein
MHRVLVAFLLILGLVLSSGCFSRSTEPVHREGNSPQRMKKDNAPPAEGGKENKKGGGLRPTD